ncbi:putative photosystem antenna protein [Helianthus annuus]|nr:putative photosystem antenna protein [Helianthus annuus]
MLWTYTRDRAAWLLNRKDSLVNTVADNLVDRLEDVKKTFPSALCLGGSMEAIRRSIRGRGETLFMFAFLERDLLDLLF